VIILNIFKNISCDRQCQAKFQTCEISDYTPFAHAQSNILHIKYNQKTDD